MFLGSVFLKAEYCLKAGNLTILVTGSLHHFKCHLPLHDGFNDEFSEKSIFHCLAVDVDKSKIVDVLKELNM